MALKRKVVGWFNRGKQLGEKELKPLTEKTVTSYRYGGEEGEEYVVVSSASEERNDSLKLERPIQQGILKLNPSPGQSPPAKKMGSSLEWRSQADMPVRMKGLQVVFIGAGECVCVGGGYTENTPTEQTVYKYDTTFDVWDKLPPAPVRWFGMAEFKGHLTLVGGREAAASASTNQITVWGAEGEGWTRPYPPMSAARSRPVVISHAHFLVVAGGRNGVLDFHVELLDGESLQWSQGAHLPSPCSPLSSWASKGTWYLLGGVQHTTILSIPLDSYIAHEGGKHSPSWDRLTPPPFSVQRITSVGGHVTVFPAPGADGVGGANVHAHQYVPTRDCWVPVGQLPSLSLSASFLLLPGAAGNLLLFGGDVAGVHFSSKVYRVTPCTGRTRKKKRATFVT